MSSARKNVLIAGQGKFVQADPEAAAKFGPGLANVKMVEEDMERAKEAGYDCTTIDLNPADPEDSLKRFNDLLRSKESWAMVVIGFGIRGRPNFTALFEDVVNASVEICPSAKFGFSTSPSGVYETIQRVLEKAK